jgi:catechol 2,3-dioxygenase-like lactoylglutathione lyase family enzyme
MEQRLTFITLGVNDLAVSRKFYEEIFGWKPDANSGGDVVFFRLNGIVLSLFPREELAKDAGVPSKGSGFRPFTLAHNVRTEQEVDSLIAILRTKGVPVIKEPQRPPGAVIRRISPIRTVIYGRSPIIRSCRWTGRVMSPVIERCN